MKENIRLETLYDEDKSRNVYFVDGKGYYSKTEALEAIVGRACALLEVD